MTNTTLIINEQEKENAKALTQSFARADVKSRAYINALGAEVCMQYLQDNDIVSDRVYNLHNIRKILEEFDISDIMLSNIHIDVRVVYNDNKIFIPKSHFDYNLTPDIYVVMQISEDYSQMEFLGFFEPKMINKNNTNGKYFFIEKEKLSSPVDLKNFIAEFSGNTSVGVSEQDIENAEYLIISMADNNVSDEDKRQLISYLKNSAELRDKFTEFENFEMLSYQAVNSIDVDVNPNKSNEIEMSSQDLDEDTVKDIELSNALNSEEIHDEEIVSDNEIPSDTMEEKTSNEVSTDITGESTANDDAFNIVEEDENGVINETKGNAIGDALKGAAVLGSEVAGAVLASAALSSVAEGAEAAKNISSAVENAGEIAAGVIQTADSISDSFMGHENLNNSSFENTEPRDEIQSSLDTLFNEVDDTVEADKIGFDDIDEDYSIDTTISQEKAPVTDTFEETYYNTTNSSRNNIIGDVFDDFETDDIQNSEDTDMITEIFGDVEDITPENNSNDDLIFEYDDNYNDDIEFSNDDYTERSSSSSSGKPIIAPVTHTPISEATDLISIESIQSGNIPPLEAHKRLFDIDNEPTSDDFVQDMPEEIVKNTVVNEPTSDDFVQDMPEEIVKDTVVNEPTSDDFVQDMPEENVNTTTTENTVADDVQDATESAVEEVTSATLFGDVEEIAQDTHNTTEDNTSANEVVDNTQDTVEDGSAEEATADAVFGDIEEITQDTHNTTEDNTSTNEVVDNTQDTVEDGSAEEATADALFGDIEEIAQDTHNTTEDNTSTDEISDNIQDVTESDTIDEIKNEATLEDVLSDETIGLLEEVCANNESETIEEPVASDTENKETIGGAEPSTAEIEELDAVSDTEDKIQEIQDSDISNEDTKDEEDTDEESQIGILFNDTVTQLDSNSLEENLSEDYKPKRKFGLMPMFAILALTIITASVVGLLVKNKNSFEDTYVQSSSDNLSNPEADNTGILANDNLLEPAIPTDLEDISPSAPAPTVTKSNPEAKAITSDDNEGPSVSKDEKQEIVKNAKAEIKKQQEQLVAPAPKTPINASKTVSLKKMSWEVPDYLSYSDNIRKYLQSAGKSIKLTLSSDLLLTNEYIYSNRVKVNVRLTKDGDIKGEPKIVASSGSSQVDKIVLQTVKDTLNVVKPQRGEVPTPEFKLGLIIYL